MLNILTVDDNRDLLDMVTMILQTAGMAVTGLESAQQLKACLSEATPDLILMDVYLGDADGRLICRELKSDPRYSQLPILLYSAGHVTEDSVIESRADDFIAKPFDIRHLIKTVRNYAQQKK